MKPQYQYLYLMSSLMLISGAALALTGHIVFDIVYLLGGLGYLLYFLIAPERQQSLRTSRLVKMSLLASVLFIISAVARFGYLDAYGQQLWILFFALGLIFMLYANIIGLYTKDKSGTKYNKTKHGKKSK